MKIGINTRLIVNKGMTGIGVYALEIASRLANIYPNINWVWYFDRKPHGAINKPKNVTFKILPPPTRHYKLIEWWFGFILPYAIKRDKLDLFFSPETYLPRQKKIPMVNVLHDLNFLHSSAYLSAELTHHYKKTFAKGLKNANATICISKFTKHDAIKNYPIQPDQLFTVYNGFGQQFLPISAEKKLAIQQKYTKGQFYLIFTGILVERKNVRNMVKAFLEYKANHSGNLKFLIVGQDGGAKSKIVQMLKSSKFRNDVLFTGYVGTNKDVQSLVAGAEAMLYVSQFEGFGLPALEAMQAKVPVITSKKSAIPEIVGDAAILCDPDNPSEIANSIADIMSNATLRNQLIQEGIRRIKYFNWEDTAKQIGEILMHNAKTSC